MQQDDRLTLGPGAAESSGSIVMSRPDEIALGQTLVQTHHGDHQGERLTHLCLTLLHFKLAHQPHLLVVPALDSRKCFLVLKSNLLSFGDGSTQGPRGSFPVRFLSKACSDIRSTMSGLAAPSRTEIKKRAAKVVKTRRKCCFCIEYRRICTDL